MRLLDAMRGPSHHKPPPEQTCVAPPGMSVEVAIVYPFLSVDAALESLEAPAKPRPKSRIKRLGSHESCFRWRFGKENARKCSGLLASSRAE